MFKFLNLGLLGLAVASCLLGVASANDDGEELGMGAIMGLIGPLCEIVPKITQCAAIMEPTGAPSTECLKVLSLLEIDKMEVDELEDLTGGDDGLGAICANFGGQRRLLATDVTKVVGGLEALHKYLGAGMMQHVATKRKLVEGPSSEDLDDTLDYLCAADGSGISCITDSFGQQSEFFGCMLPAMGDLIAIFKTIMESLGDSAEEMLGGDDGFDPAALGPMLDGVSDLVDTMYEQIKEMVPNMCAKNADGKRCMLTQSENMFDDSHENEPNAAMCGVAVAAGCCLGNMLEVQQQTYDMKKAICAATEEDQDICLAIDMPETPDLADCPVISEPCVIGTEARSVGRVQITIADCDIEVYRALDVGTQADIKLSIAKDLALLTTDSFEVGSFAKAGTGGCVVDIVVEDGKEVDLQRKVTIADALSNLGAAFTDNGVSANGASLTAGAEAIVEIQEGDTPELPEDPSKQKEEATSDGVAATFSGFVTLFAAVLYALQ